jgi:hypothetical protein
MLGFALLTPTYGPRPDGITGKLESLYVLHCQGQPDECAALKADVREEIANAKIKQAKMFFDEKLYEHAFNIRNPAVTRNNTTWIGHSDDLSGRIGKIRNMILLGKMMRCDMSEEERMASTLYVPNKPWDY